MRCSDLQSIKSKLVMPRKWPDRCKNGHTMRWLRVDGVNVRSISLRGLCRICGDQSDRMSQGGAACTGKKKRIAGAKGGAGCSGQKKRRAGEAGGSRGCGASKARRYSANGRSTIVKSKHKTWQPDGVTFPMFQIMLAELHKGRELGNARPWLRADMLPPWIRKAGAGGLNGAIAIMNDTKFGNPDRYKDRVSCEVSEVLQQTTNNTRAAAIALAVRFKCSPRGLAGRLLHCTDLEFDHAVNDYKCANAYRQLSFSNATLARVIRKAAGALVKRAPYNSWHELEDEAAAAVQRLCGRGNLEQFAARQAAADLFRCHGWVRDGGPASRPHTSRAGPGAQVGWYLGQKAAGANQFVRCPTELPYQEQTERCEYSKLVKRLNFNGLRRFAMYRPAG